MANYKYKLKEADGILKPKDVDPELLDRIERRYGKIDYKNDFFNDTLSTYFKTVDTDNETGQINHQIIKLANFGDALREMSEAVKALTDLSKTADGKADPTLAILAQDARNVFNKFRTHIRKEYPEQYVQIKNLLDEMSTLGSTSFFTSGGEGENHNGPSPRKSTYGAYTQAGFKKVNEGPGATMGPGPKAGPEGVIKNKYITDFKYKLVNKNKLNKAAKGIEVKKLWEDTDVESYLKDANINKPSNQKWVGGRLLAFDEIERKLNELIPLMQQAKHETLDYYKQNPDSFNVVYGTDLAKEYLDDVIELFKK
jgi:hypothetical protein